MRLYKFLQDQNGTPTHGAGRWLMPRGKQPGTWRKERGPLHLCARGTLHYCEPDQLARWIAPVLVEIEVRGETLRAHDKCGALEMRVLRVVTAWDETAQRRFAVACAYGALLAERERGREPHADSWRAVATAHAFAEGRATLKELLADAATATAADAAYAAAAAAYAADAAATAAAATAATAAYAAAAYAAAAAAYAAAATAATATAADAAYAAAATAERVKQSRYLLTLCGEI